MCFLGVFGKTVKVMGQRKASHNLLYINEINLWDSLQTSFAPSLNLNLCSWIFVIARNNSFMIILERITSIVFSVHLLSSLKNLFNMAEKKTIFI